MHSIVFFAITDGVEDCRQMKNRFAEAGLRVLSNTTTEYIFPALSESQQALLKEIPGVKEVTKYVSASRPPTDIPGVFDA